MEQNKSFIPNCWVPLLVFLGIVLISTLILIALKSYFTT